MNEKCFALRKGGTCDALATRNCAGYQTCPFYKPVWKQQQHRKKTNMRLQRLPMAQQIDISEQYYHGDMPWGRDMV